MLPEHFVCLIAAQARGAKVPAQHVAVGIEHDERIIFDRFHQEAEACFAPSQFSRRGILSEWSDALFLLDRLTDSTIDTFTNWEYVVTSKATPNAVRRPDDWIT